MRDLNCKIDALTDVTIPRMIRLALGTAPQNTETQQDPQSTRCDERTGRNDDHDVNNVSCHTIDDDAQDITEDLN